MREIIFLILVFIQYRTRADYTLDDTYWNEESPKGGEVERLLREYWQNRDLVQSIGAHFYQIIYPVQLRHHEKMGISTREVGSPKFPQRNFGGYGTDGGNQEYAGRGKSRTGKHFHRTSLLIKAFNHKFRLDLELNTQLLAPNLMQKHFLPKGAEQVSKQEIEHCYYHGTVKDYPGSSAAFHTCNGVSGVIHVGNETFVIHPFYGGDLSQHPHVIFEAQSKVKNKGCGNTGNWDRQMGINRRPKPANAEQRFRRDVRETIKFVETAIVIDKAMFERRNGSTRAEVVHDAIQVANIADLYFRTLNTRVSVVYIETWQAANQVQINKSQDISRALVNFNEYTSRSLFKVEKDTTQLLTGEIFTTGEAGMSVPDHVCTAKAIGISVDIDTYEPHLLAGTMAHMIGHNLGMTHDDGRENCCRDWHGCIMAQSIVGLHDVQPYKFSECSLADYENTLHSGSGVCLLNKPNEFAFPRLCGNGIVEEGEDCDCGAIEECRSKDPCCDPFTCKLSTGSKCASGPCCQACKLVQRGRICRESTNECDLPEFCDGENGQCPPDVYKKNGNPCANNTGYCFNGICPTFKLQCEQIWGYNGAPGEKECYEQFNLKGSIWGHCGVDNNGNYIKCDLDNLFCGSLHCQGGTQIPTTASQNQIYSRTIISIMGKKFECKATSGQDLNGELPDMGLVRDGTPCGENLICVNQTCSNLFMHIDQTKCPSNHVNMECSGHGVCNNENKCFCDIDWSGPDCSIPTEHAEDMENYTSTEKPPNLNKGLMNKQEIIYVNSHSANTVYLVATLMAAVGGVFIVFAMMALCYRSVVVHKNFSLCLRKSTMPKYDKPYVKKPLPKKYANKIDTIEDGSEDSANKILPFEGTPCYSRCDSQRSLYRGMNHNAVGSRMASPYQEHQMQKMKRLGMSSGSDEDPIHSGEEESVAFIDIPPNNLSKLPEKGILKKPCPYGTTEPCHKEKWSEMDSHSDNQETLSQSDNNVGADIRGTGAVLEVERTLKSLNGYHEDILEALRTAASHRTGPASSTGASSSSEDLLRMSITAAVENSYRRSSSQDKLCDGVGHGRSPQTHTVLVEGSPTALLRHHRRTSHRSDADDEDDDVPPSCGPIRIRNLEDLIRQLEHHSARHMSPSGSEDIRMSETEADRHYRLDMQSGRCRGREEEPRLVCGRYRHPIRRATSPFHLQEEDGIYETADHLPSSHPVVDTLDSESVDFIQAQEVLVRSASEEVLPGATEEPAPLTNGDRGYYPSPPSNSNTDSSSVGSGATPTVTIAALEHSNGSSRDTIESSGNEQSALIRPGKKYPEYKH
nr:PREDICTED: disintegrin and metalloproteinase domain-containing protein 12 [Bemisia tabaci]